MTSHLKCNQISCKLQSANGCLMKAKNYLVLLFFGCCRSFCLAYVLFFFPTLGWIPPRARLSTWIHTQTIWAHMATHKHVGWAEKKIRQKKRKEQKTVQTPTCNCKRTQTHTFMECLSWKDNPETTTYTTFNWTKHTLAVKKRKHGPVYVVSDMQYAINFLIKYDKTSFSDEFSSL